MRRDDRPRSAMLSVPERWSELYFNLLPIICAIGWAFLIWYEVTRAPPLESNYVYVDVAMAVMLQLGAVGLGAAIVTFVILKARDVIMMTWERYREIRYESGREQGRKEGREEGRAEGRAEGRQEMIAELMQLLEGADDANSGTHSEALDAMVAVIRERDGADRRPDSEIMEEVRAIVRRFDEGRNQ